MLPVSDSVMKRVALSGPPYAMLVVEIPAGDLTRRIGSATVQCGEADIDPVEQGSWAK
jgi:hypothetical protein